MPHLLWLLSADVQGAVAAALREPKALACVPAWMWLVWTPQLMTGLYRGERPVARLILQLLVRAYPQVGGVVVVY